MSKSAPPKFIELNELASKRNGGKILFATDDWFAEAENLLSDDEAVFKADLYTDFGKWMDGWETRRRRSPGHDWCIIKLGVTGIIHGIDVDTAFFTGNYAPRFSLQAAHLTPEEEELIPARTGNTLGSAANKETFQEIKQLKSETWTEIIPRTQLQPGYSETHHNYFPIDFADSWTHLRLNIYPDGGIARLRVFGESFYKPAIHETIDLISMNNGGVCVAYSNAHYGHPKNLIRPDLGVNMGDGWETARRLDRPAILEANISGVLQVPGNEWAVFRLGCVGDVTLIEVDTRHFKGNFPDSVKIEGIFVKNSTEEWDSRTVAKSDWKMILPTSKLSPHRSHYYYEDDLSVRGLFSHIKVTIAPDGGVSRLRLFGTVTASLM